MHVANAIDIAKRHTAAVTAIALDQFKHMLCKRRIFTLHALVQINSISVVVDRQNFLVHTALLKI